MVGSAWPSNNCTKSGRIEREYLKLVLWRRDAGVRGGGCGGCLEGKMRVGVVGVELDVELDVGLGVELDVETKFSTTGEESEEEEEDTNDTAEVWDCCRRRGLGGRAGWLPCGLVGVVVPSKSCEEVKPTGIPSELE
jgi:hypothetical protein